MKLKDQLSREKPWAILGYSRKRYMAARPWAAFGSREKFEEFLLVIHAEKPEAIQALKENAEARCCWRR